MICERPGSPLIHDAGNGNASESPHGRGRSPPGFGALLIACYLPILRALVAQWNNDADMGHGFFVPLPPSTSFGNGARECWPFRPKPNWWGLAVVVWGGLQLWMGILAAELFT